MKKYSRNRQKYLRKPVDISDDDILEAMREIEGYLDITPADFKEVYQIAYKHAVERLMHFIKARDIMTKEVIFVNKETSLQKTAEIMASHGISGVPVTGDNGEVTGVISEKDFLFHMGSKEATSFMTIIVQCLIDDGCIAVPLRDQKAENIMTKPAITVDENTPLSEIINIFAQKNINRVPVLNPEKKLVGIVSRADVLQTSFSEVKG